MNTFQQTWEGKRERTLDGLNFVDILAAYNNINLLPALLYCLQMGFLRSNSQKNTDQGGRGHSCQRNELVIQ